MLPHMSNVQDNRKYLNPGEIVLNWIPKHWPLTPIGLNKNAYILNWQNNPRTVEEIQDEITVGRCKAVGLLSGPCFNHNYGLLWVDVDGPSVKDKVEELSHQAYHQALPNTLTISSGKEGRERRLYQLPQDQFTALTRNKYTWSTNVKNEKLEILWTNHQGILMGFHPETNGYYTPVGCGFEWVHSLPAVPAWLLDAINTKNARMGPPVKQVTRVQGPGFGFSLVHDNDRDVTVACEALWSLPAELADDYETWIIVGQALHSVDESLIDDWDNWSQQSEKYQPGECLRKWQSFNSDNGIGLGTLIEISKEYSNVIHQRLAFESASAPSDADLDFIEAYRQQEEAFTSTIMKSQKQQEQRLEHIGTIVNDLTDVIEDTLGYTFTQQAQDAWNEYIASGGLNLPDNNSNPSGKSKTSKKQSDLRNPPTNIIRDRVIAIIGDTTVCDITEETFYQYGYHFPGVWSRLSAYESSAMIQDALDRIKLPRGYSAGTVQAITDLVGPQLAFTDWNNNSNLLNFTNGVLDLTTGELQDHDKEFYLVNQLPFDFDPGATCPKTQQWLAFTQYNDSDMVNVLRAWLRAVLVGRSELQMFLEVVGAAGAGKTSFANLCTALVGFKNSFSTRLNLLESNRFEVSGSYNKKLVVINDADRYGGSVEILKAMTGGDQLRMEVKYQKQTGSGFIYRGLIMTTANESIQTTDLTGGLFRRRLTIPFTRSRNISVGDTPDQTMIGFDRHGNPYGYLADELPGIVNWVLEMSEEEMLRYTKHASEFVKPLQLYKTEQLSENNNIMDWLNDRVVYDPAICSIVGDRKETEGEYYYQHADRWLYPSYCDHCRKSNVREVGRRRFISLLNDICIHQLKMKVKLIHGNHNRYMFRGLTIKRPNDATYDAYPLILNYSLDKAKYNYIYGTERDIEEQINDGSNKLSHTNPLSRDGGIPDLPF